MGKMERIYRRLSGKFGSHWIKVRFYKNKPNINGAKRLKNARFCEATREAILHPVLLDRESISCPGAQYAFGWSTRYKNGLLQNCYDKRQTKKNTLESMLSQAHHFKKPFKYIGLNMQDQPDLIMSYMPPAEIMNLLKMYHNSQGVNLDVSLCAMMPICGGIAVRTYLDEKIGISFGCDDSRKYADMRREELVVSIPKKLFNMFGA
ncbi:MAG: DUF169 domain-containing protein [Candidatus Omnitrophica bacterium]|nr:DUF169 domain-containing protein [Candidatus Omnitrophota bacterium]